MASPRMYLVWKEDYVEKSIRERFLPYVKVLENGCWEWTRSHDKKNGYGCFCFTGKTMRSHRFILLYYLGIENTPDVVDHLCRNPPCVNPKHLEFVTVTENTLRGTNFSAINARKTHCDRDHELSGNNLYVRPNGARCCRNCQNISNRKSLKKHKERRLLKRIMKRKKIKLMLVP